MNRSHRQSRLTRRVAQTSATMTLLLLLWHAPAAAQKCNPVIDGTYCETQMPKGGVSSPRSPVTMRPIEDIGSSISTSSNSPATLGGISFSRGTNCIGLLRRGVCNN